MCDGYLSFEFYVTVGDKVIEAMNGSGLTFKVFKIQLVYSRVKLKIDSRSKIRAN